MVTFHFRSRSQNCSETGVGVGVGVVFFPVSESIRLEGWSQSRESESRGVTFFHLRSESLKCLETRFRSQSRIISSFAVGIGIECDQGSESESDGVVFFSLWESETKMFRNWSWSRESESYYFFFRVEVGVRIE